ncbi:Splicing factor [Dissophora globulifera]|nr:Splicing factor [Dissophora globulifera]
MSSKDGFSDGEEDDFDTAEDTVTPETLEAIATLKASLVANPNLYEQHTQLIALLKGAVMLEELRAAREAMSAVFPLTEELWMEWIGDEANLATSIEEKRHLLELYERATSDYLSINIWKAYVDYALQEYTEATEQGDSDPVVNKESLRALFKKADRFTGRHVPQSHLVWNIWRDFEVEQLELQDPPLPEDISRVKAMYLNRIAIPHVELEDTFSSLSSFITKYEGESYEEAMVQCNSIASKTRRLLSALTPHEDELIATGNSLETLTKYLDNMTRKHSGEFALIRTLFERGLATHCLVPALWNDYVTFLLSLSPQKKEYDLAPQDVLNIAKRSTRNCPWSGDLWENLVLLMELQSKPQEEKDTVFTSALSDPTLLASPQEVVKVLMARCTSVYRQVSKGEVGHKQVREAFEHALSVIGAAGGDPYCRLERLWIELECNVYGDLDKTRELWKVVEVKQNKMADAWIAQAEMERKLKNPKGARTVYSRAWQVAKTLDYPEKALEAWLEFERENGDLVAYKDALARVRSAMKSIEQFRAQAASIYPQDMVYEVDQPYAHAEAAVDTGVSRKRKMSAPDNEHASKVTKTDNGHSKDADKKHGAFDAKPLDISAGRHEDTCFVANFPDEMTEQRLKELFQEYGTVVRCTIPTRKAEKGKRQFAYIQFSSAEEAHAALALHGRDVGHRLGLSVRISDTTQKTRSTGGPPLPRVSRHEVHISGISNELKEDELQKLISLKDADAALTLNGTIFHGTELAVTRRVFKKEAQENTTRRDRRKHLQGDRQQEGEEGAGHGGEGSEKQQGEGAEAEGTRQAAEFLTSSGSDKKEAVESAAKSDTPATTEPKKPMVSLTSMQPRTMRPRPKPKMPNSHLKPPTKAFVPASAPAAEAQEGPGAGSSKDEAAAAPVAPKSNAEFRALMLSGALKKRG